MTTIDEIREAKPVPNALHDVIQTLSVKLDSAARYGLYQDDAREEGFDDCVELFGRLAEQEQGAIQELLGCLRTHVSEVAPQ